MGQEHCTSSVDELVIIENINDNSHERNNEIVTKARKSPKLKRDIRYRSLCER